MAQQIIAFFQKSVNFIIQSCLSLTEPYRKQVPFVSVRIILKKIKICDTNKRNITVILHQRENLQLPFHFAKFGSFNKMLCSEGCFFKLKQIWKYISAPIIVTFDQHC